MPLELVIPDIDPLELVSIFQKPGRNDPCHCNSGKKYKKCHEESDEAAWRFVARKISEADAVCTFLRTIASTVDFELEEMPDAE